MQFNRVKTKKERCPWVELGCEQSLTSSTRSDADLIE